MENNNDVEPLQQSYRIGAVSKLTGISPDTLRVWERRYQVVKPSRTDKGGRLYSRDEVSRLVKIKALVDQGHAISTLVSLSDEQLHERLSQLSGVTHLGENLDSQRICVVGQALSIRIYYASKPENIEVVETFARIDDFLNADIECDSLIVELPVIDPESVKLIDNQLLRDRGKRIIVVYAFGQTKLVRQLARQGVYVLKAPLADDLLWQVLSNPLHSGVKTPADDINIDNAALEVVPDRIFSHAQLAFCANVESKLQCECPHHMSQMIETMVAFERYSASCENMTTADAALHGYLHVMTARARHTMEQALETLLAAEHIDLPQLMQAS
jgi:DNA-binding transcriptional MerR regulator